MSWNLLLELESSLFSTSSEPKRLSTTPYSLLTRSRFRIMYLLMSLSLALWWLGNPHHSHDLPWSPLLSAACRAANFNFTPLLSGPEINASFEKWKSNCLHRADDWRWLRTNYLAPGSTSVCLLSLANPVFSPQASRLSYCFSTGGRSSAPACEI